MSYQQITTNKKIIATLLVLLSISGCENAGTQTPKQSEPSVSQTQDVFENEVVLTQLVNTQSADYLEWVASNTSHFSHDDKSFTIGFLANENISKMTIKPNKPWDLTAYSPYNLAFDIVNESTESVHLYLSLENKDGDIQSRSISLPREFSGTVYFPLTGKEAETETGFWGDMPPWNTQDQLMIWRSWRAAQVDLSQIYALNFFTIGLLDDKQVKISDIRLRENPASDPQWMKNVLDQYGQNARVHTPLHISDDETLLQNTKQELAALDSAPADETRSIYGGYKNGPKLEATGYFRTQKIEGKWWMVDPEGYIFFSHGPANVRMANLSTLTGVDFKDDSVRHRSADELTPEDSMGVVTVSEKVRESRYIASTLRHDLFSWLPEYDAPLAKHYSYRRSTHKGAMPHGETYNFYRANLERKYGESFMDKWYDVTLQRMKNWGFTSFGNWVDPNFYDRKQVPYFANGWIIGDFKTLSGKVNHWGLMPDAYDPVFAERAKATIEAIAKDIKNSPWCAGIFIDNEKSWGEREGSVEARYGVILDALSKNAQNSPAKQAFTGYLKAKYSSIDALNLAWQTDIENWQTFENGVEFESYTQAHVDDLSMLLTRLGEQYFTVVHDTLADILPNHLYMGARMANWGMPDEIIKASVTYSDVLSFNIYEDGMQDHYWQFLEQVDLPVVIGEFHIGTATDSGMFNPGIVHASDQADRARKYKAYMQSVLSKPYMVGAHWFQYVDEPITGRAFDGENANIGFVNVTDTPYPEMIQAVKEVTSTMYQNRLEK
ncbi:beta-galactosidase [Thalassotalea agarivorans]|uniref:Agarase n=1 Tax=Thalassotalea agarivorans TaxID=349064 RepID=A0A1I0ATF6_THASX|nr:beta-galactosidase [Thalassotalea agarivorans]SES97693.1 agarase [Thalassotalea agarivorans]